MTNARGQRSQGPEGLLADGEEAAIPIPVADAPAEVEAAPGSVPAEVGHAAVPVRVDPGRAEGDDRELPLDLGVGRPERQQLFDRRGAQTQLVELRLDLLRARHLVQVDELEVDLDGALALDLEVLRVDVAVLVVVATRLHHLLDGLGVVDGDGVVDRRKLQRSHHQLAEVATVGWIRDERLEVVERPSLLLDALDDLLEGPHESAKPGDGTFIRACHLTAPLRVAYIVPTLCRRNAYHGCDRRKSPAFFRAIYAEISQKKAKILDHKKNRLTGYYSTKLPFCQPCYALFSLEHFSAKNNTKPRNKM